MQDVWDILQQGAPGDDALVVPGGPRFSYQELRDEVQRAADGLAALGIGHSDAVASVFPNGAEAVLVFLASALAGCAAPLNPGYTESEFSFYLNDVSASVLLVPPGRAEPARSARPTGTRVVETSLDPDGRLRLEAGTQAGISAGATAPRTATHPATDDLALMLHTSGTTGRPKRVPLQQRHLAASVTTSSRPTGWSPSDVSVCVMPLFHVHGLVASTLATLASGGTVVVPAPFNPLGFWARRRGARRHLVLGGPDHAVHAARPGEVAAPGSHAAFRAHLQRRALARADGERRAADRGARARGIRDDRGLPPDGLESAPARRAQARLGRAGRPEWRSAVVDDGMAASCRPGMPGEVVVRGPNVISAYADAPEANAVSFSDGWFRTGDEGVLDGEGYLTLIAAHQGADQPRRREDRAARDRRGAARAIRRSPKRSRSPRLMRRSARTSPPPSCSALR